MTNNLREQLGAEPGQLSELFSEAFSTDLFMVEEMNQSDTMKECERLFQRQRMIEDWLEGRASIDDVGDMLCEHGIDPFEWLAISCERMSGGG